MKMTNLLVIFVCILSGICFSQESQPGTSRSNTQIIDFILDFQEKRILEVAETMPTQSYGFAPSGGEFKRVRTFAGQLKHIASDNYLLGAGILGERPPRDAGTGEDGASAVQTKEEIIAYLKDSFSYMRRASAAIDDTKRPIPTPSISPWPEGTATRLGVAIEDCLHTWDHYGQLVEYLRMNGIVPPASGAAAATAPVKPRATVSAAIDSWIGNAEKDVVSAAEAMPEEKYVFAPSGGEFAGVRTFGEQVKHLAANNYRMAERMLGQTATADQEAETGPDAVRSKREILDYAKGSFAALHHSVATITAENVVTPVWPTRVGTSRQNTRVQFAVDAIAHSYDHYGQMVEYLRMNGIVPPASR